MKIICNGISHNMLLDKDWEKRLSGATVWLDGEGYATASIHSNGTFTHGFPLKGLCVYCKKNYEICRGLCNNCRSRFNYHRRVGNLEKMRKYVSVMKESLRVNGPSKRVRLHKLINNTPQGLMTDHINGNKLDNRRCNLRTSTNKLNQFNRRSTNIHKGSVGGLGVFRQNHGWVAKVGNSKKIIYLGYFSYSDRDKAEQRVKEYRDTLIRDELVQLENVH